MAYDEVIYIGESTRSCYSVCMPVTTRHYKDPYKAECSTNTDAALVNVFNDVAPGKLIDAWHMQTLLSRTYWAKVTRYYSDPYPTGPVELYNTGAETTYDYPANNAGKQVVYFDRIYHRTTTVGSTFEKPWYSSTTYDNVNWLLHYFRLDTSARIDQFTIGSDVVDVPVGSSASLDVDAINATVTVHSNGDFTIYSWDQYEPSVFVDMTFRVRKSDNTTSIDERRLYGRGMISAGTLIIADRPRENANFIKNLNTITSRINFGTFYVGHEVDAANFNTLVDAAIELWKVCNCITNYYDTNITYCSCNY